METTLTIRIDRKEKEALKQMAVAAGRSESALVREMIGRELERGFRYERIRSLVGSLEDPSQKDSDTWRAQLRKRNWR